MKLSAHFTLEEMTASQTATRRGLNNTPNDSAIDNLRRLCLVLEEVRKVVGKPITVTSGYRGRELNQAIGGASNSQHTYGCAADIKVHGLTPDEIIRMILTANIRFDQLIREYDSWVHISVPINGKSWRKQCLIIDKQGARLYGDYKPMEKPKCGIFKKLFRRGDA